MYLTPDIVIITCSMYALTVNIIAYGFSSGIGGPKDLIYVRFIVQGEPSKDMFAPFDLTIANHSDTTLPTTVLLHPSGGLRVERPFSL